MTLTCHLILHESDTVMADQASVRFPRVSQIFQRFQMLYNARRTGCVRYGLQGRRRG